MKIMFLVSGTIRSNFSYRALALAKGLKKLGHEVSIMAPSADKYNNFIPEKINSLDGVRILQPFQYKTKRPEINLIPYLISATRTLFREKPDLIYIYKPTPIATIGLLGKLFHKTPVILDMDDLGSEVMRIEGHPAYQRKLVAWCEHITAKHADRIVAASTYLRDRYQKQFPDTPIHLMPNGIDETWLTPTTPSTAKKRIVFMGAINRRSILEPLFDTLPNIITQHPDLSVLIIGDGAQLSYFKEKAKNLHIEANVAFMGWLNIEEARSHLHAGDIGYNYMPDELTIKAASNMKTPQYMARGIAPIVSNVGDLPATVEFGNAGYVVPADDPKALEKELSAALSDEKRMERSRQAQTYAAQHFDWNLLAAKFDQWLGPAKKSRTASGKKKIYFVSINVPGNIGGGEIRNYNLIRQLIKQADAEASVFCTSPADPEQVKRQLEANITVHGYVARFNPVSSMEARAILWNRVPPFMERFNSSGIGDLFRAACERSMPDVVHIEQIHAYYCIRPHIAWLKRNGVKIVLDCHNVEFRSFYESLELFSTAKKMVGKYLTPYLKKMEIEAAKRSNLVLTCSDADAKFFKRYNPKTVVIPNGVDCSEFQPTQKHEAATLLFMGSVGYPPNADAMEFYLRSIHPIVKTQIPDITLLAIGTTAKWLESIGIQDASIDPLGFVDSIDPYLARAVIGVCPVRYGSGTRLKILTYLAAGLPVVSTHKGAEGVNYVDGRDLVFADEAQDFADAIVALFKDHERREKIGRQGRAFVQEHYDWDIIGKKLAHAYHHEL